MNRIGQVLPVLFLFFLPFMISAQNNPDSQLSASNSVVFKKLVTPNPSVEAEALYRYLQTIFGEKILSGQMCTPQGINEAEYISTITAKQPALRGIDLIRESSNNTEINNAIKWWNQGGIPLLMWSWEAPTYGDGFDSSRKEISIERCFQEGTPEYQIFWEELNTKANHLEKLRDANVPVLWCPFQEANGNDFWWGKQGPVQLKKLWQTMFNYFVNERQLNNLIWVQCFSEDTNREWFPGNGYVDIIGASSFEKDTDPRQKMFNDAQKLTNNKTSPVAYNQCSLMPLIDECRTTGTMWSWWMQRPTSHLENIEPQYLYEMYNHKLVITLDEVPDIVKDYSSQGLKREWHSGATPSFSSFKAYNFGANSGSHTLEKDQIEIIAKGKGIDGEKDDGYFVFKQMEGDFDISVQVLNLSPTNMRTMAGIMARVNLNRSSPHVFFRVFPQNNLNNNVGGCEFNFREKKGNLSQIISPAPQITEDNFKVDFPNTWIRLKRRGNIFKSYLSHDDIHWYIYSVHSQKMPDKLLVGLAVSSHNAEKSTIAEFKTINVTWE